MQLQFQSANYISMRNTGRAGDLGEGHENSDGDGANLKELNGNIKNWCHLLYNYDVVVPLLA